MQASASGRTQQLASGSGAGCRRTRAGGAQQRARPSLRCRWGVRPPRAGRSTGSNRAWKEHRERD